MPADLDNSGSGRQSQVKFRRENRAGRISSCAVDVEILQMTI